MTSYCDKYIKIIAKHYIYKKDATLKSTAEYFDISRSELNSILNEDLKIVSPRLYGKVQEKKISNTLKVRFGNKKTNWFTRLFKKR